MPFGHVGMSINDGMKAHGRVQIQVLQPVDDVKPFGFYLNAFTVGQCGRPRLPIRVSPDRKKQGQYFSTVE